MLIQVLVAHEWQQRQAVEQVMNRVQVNGHRNVHTKYMCTTSALL